MSVIKNIFGFFGIGLFLILALMVFWYEAKELFHSLFSATYREETQTGFFGILFHLFITFCAGGMVYGAVITIMEIFTA